MTEPQTIKEIQRLLDSYGCEPVKRFGQNFLIDGNIMRMVAEAGELDAERDVVLEVGPGTGSLTALLAEQARRVVAVEVDTHLAELLRDVLAEQLKRNVTLVVGDALSGKHALSPLMTEAVALALADVPEGRLKLVANLPYVIATPLVIDLLLSEPRPHLLAFTVQKEVADRLLADSSSLAYGAISVLVQGLAQVERLHDLSPNVFWPKPQVHSTLVRIRPIPERYRELADLKLWQSVASGLFFHRRKTILKSMQHTPGLEELKSAWPEILARAGIGADVRGETLNVRQAMDIYHAAQELKS